MEEQGDSDTDQTTAKQPALPISQFLQQNFRNLPKFKQLCFEYGSSLIGVNSVLCGTMAHNLFRSSLKVRKHFLLSSLPVTVVPVIITNMYYELFITQPLIQGSLSCPMCAVVRGGYIGLSMGGVAPILLSAFINLMMVPEVLRTPVKGSVLREMISFTKPVFSRLKYLLLFQTVTSVFIASRQVGTIEELLQMPINPETQEKLIE